MGANQVRVIRDARAGSVRGPSPGATFVKNVGGHGICVARFASLGVLASLRSTSLRASSTRYARTLAEFKQSHARILVRYARILAVLACEQRLRSGDLGSPVASVHSSSLTLIARALLREAHSSVRGRALDLAQGHEDFEAVLLSSYLERGDWHPHVCGKLTTGRTARLVL